MKDVLFHRDYRGFSGGHLKVWNYFQHVATSRSFDPTIYFTPASIWDDANPWSGMRSQALPRWAPEAADVLFLAGEDWLALPASQRDWSATPIVNLIQGVRHADMTLPLATFLGHRAVRICVSPEVEDAILATGRVNGPVFTIPNGIDRRLLPAPCGTRDIDVLIAGVKHPDMARQVAEALAPLRVECLTRLIPRTAFLETLSRAEIAVFLPLPVEGFYLPALEGMALGTLVVCPDCVGNRSFCLDGINCFRPEHDVSALLNAVRLARSLDPAQKAALLAAAGEMSRVHDVSDERARFLGILENVSDLWQSGDGTRS